MSKQSIGITLRELRNKYGYQQNEIARILEKMGLQLNKNAVSRWENGHNSPNLPQFMALCRLYHLTDPYAVFMENDYSELEHMLNREGREKLEEYRQLLIGSGRYAPIPLGKVVAFPTEKVRRTRPLYDARASAGTGQFLDSDSYEMVEIEDDVPDEASFGLYVNGDSMEPTLCNGQQIWVHQQPTLESSDIGVFFVDGNAFVKEYKETEDGVQLVSHNAKYDPIPLTEYSTFKIYGKVLLPL